MQYVYEKCCNRFAYRIKRKEHKNKYIAIKLKEKNKKKRRKENKHFLSKFSNKENIYIEINTKAKCVRNVDKLTSAYRKKKNKTVYN